MASDSTLYLFTSLTAGSSHIITATSRLETILKANKIPFRAIDCATDEKARMIWGRRSKGRKLPGLVRFGFVVGDLEQIEEWNEHGELKEQIKATEDLGFGSGTANASAHANPINIRGTLRGEPPPPVLTSPPIPSNPSSRGSSQGRHISIEEPSAKEKERDRDRETKEDEPSETKAKSPAKETPQNLLFKQLGAEAAARAKDRKTSTPKPTPAVVPITSPTSTTQTPTPAAVKSEETETPSIDPDVTAAKTPAVLAAEGKAKTTTEKIENVSSSTSPTATSEDEGDKEEKSTEEQLLALRKTSTQVVQPSSLSKSMAVDDTETPDEADEGKEETKVPQSVEESPEKQHAAAVTEAEANSKQDADSTTVSEPKEEIAAGAPASSEPIPAVEQQTDTAPLKPESVTSLVASSSSSQPLPERRRSHRGSSLEEADKEAIRKAEEAIRIKEEEEEEEEEEEDDGIGKTRAETQRALEANASDTPKTIGGLEIVDEMEEKVLKNAQVKIGKDVGGDENIQEREAVGASSGAVDESESAGVSAAPEASSTQAETEAPTQQMANDEKGGEEREIEREAATNIAGGVETKTSIAGAGTGADEIGGRDDEDEDDGEKDERPGEDDDEARKQEEKEDVGRGDHAEKESVSGTGSQEDGKRRSAEQEDVDAARGEQENVSATVRKQRDDSRLADGHEEEENVDVELVEEQKEDALKKAGVDLPSGKETDIEAAEQDGTVEGDAKGTPKEPEQASKTVGD